MIASWSFLQLPDSNEPPEWYDPKFDKLPNGDKCYELNEKVVIDFNAKVKKPIARETRVIINEVFKLVVIKKLRAAGAFDNED